MKQLLLVYICLSFSFGVFAQCPAPKAYTNPVIPGFFPDPSVVRVGDDYYCINSTFEYFPAIVISHSKDLVNWEQIGHVFSKSEDLDLSYFFDGMGIWAPDISYYNGEFYIFFCTVQLSKDRSTNVRGNYMVKSKSIYGPWSKPVQITDFGSDPSHFVDDDGEHYMLFAAGIPTGNGTKIVKLNKECTKMVEEPRWMETEGKKSAPEGPHLLKKDGYYYFVMAASSGLFNGHHMLVARSKSVYGPYENSPNNPYLTQRMVDDDPFATLESRRNSGAKARYQSVGARNFTRTDYLERRWLANCQWRKRATGCKHSPEPALDACFQSCKRRVLR